MESQKFLELIEKIRSDTYVESELDLHVNEFDEEHFVDMLDDEQGVALAEALEHNTHIIRVNLRGNEIGDKSAIALAGVNTLESLNLDETLIDPSALVGLAKSGLKSLTIWLGMGSKHLLANQKVIETLAENKSIENLNILQGSYNPDSIADLIARNTTIKTLELSNIEDEALKFISYNKTLKRLHIGGNSLTNKGVSHLAGNTTIEHLEIYGSHVTDEGAKFLVSLPTLKRLHIYSSDITAEGAKVFIRSKLQEFSIGGKYGILSPEDADNINLVFRDVRDDSDQVQQTKKAKVDLQDSFHDYYTEQSSLLGDTQSNLNSYNLDDSGVLHQ